VSSGPHTTTGPLPIGQFVKLVQSTVKQDPLFQHQALRGEVSQWKIHNGTVYFKLRDDDGQLDCVIWRNARLSVDPSIKEGSDVVVIGSLDLWPKRGNLQLVVRKIEPVQTVGVLEETKRALIEALKHEGALDRPRMALPGMPKHVAIVTGAESAALSDMKRLIFNRWPGLRTTVVGVLVQGDRAVNELVRGLAVTRALSRADVAEQLGLPPVDVVIVGRGGGSVEDLWAFNLEPVARAILASPVPVISAVGHEQDVLVSDLVADARASTPSNAVEILVPDRHSVMMMLDDVDMRMGDAVKRRFGELRQRLMLLTTQLKHAPGKGVFRAKEHLATLSSRMNRSTEHSISIQQQRLARLEATLIASHPHRVLERGYTMVQNDEGDVLTTLASLQQGQTVNLQFADGRAAADIHTIEPKEEEK
jgi:exodeoxyribonuclease VII large subunit